VSSISLSTQTVKYCKIPDLLKYIDGLAEGDNITLPFFKNQTTIAKTWKRRGK